MCLQRNHLDFLPTIPCWVVIKSAIVFRRVLKIHIHGPQFFEKKKVLRERERYIYIYIYNHSSQEIKKNQTTTHKQTGSLMQKQTSNSFAFLSLKYLKNGTRSVSISSKWAQHW